MGRGSTGLMGFMTRVVAAAAVMALGVGAVLMPGPANTASAASGQTIGRLGGVAAGGWMLLWESDSALARDLDTIASSGATWVRFDFDWASAEPTRGGYNWAPIDRVVAAVSSRGMNVLATAAYTPAWARPANTSDKYPPSGLSTYADFAGAAAARYGPRGVHAWEIWNEPNMSMFWMPKPSASAYTSMLTLASTAIHTQDPAATVITAGLAPAGAAGDGSTVAPRAYLTAIYNAGGRGSLDAVGIHPYDLPYAPSAAG